MPRESSLSQRRHKGAVLESRSWTSCPRNASDGLWCQTKARKQTGLRVNRLAGDVPVTTHRLSLATRLLMYRSSRPDGSVNLGSLTWPVVNDANLREN